MHPTYVFKNILKGQALRTFRLTTKDSTMFQQVTLLKKEFRDRGYTEDECDEHLQMAYRERGGRGKSCFSEKNMPLVNRMDGYRNKRMQIMSTIYL